MPQFRLCVCVHCLHCSQHHRNRGKRRTQLRRSPDPWDISLQLCDSGAFTVGLQITGTFRYSEILTITKSRYELVRNYAYHGKISTGCLSAPKVSTRMNLIQLHDNCPRAFLFVWVPTSYTVPRFCRTNLGNESCPRAFGMISGMDVEVGSCLVLGGCATWSKVHQPDVPLARMNHVPDALSIRGRIWNSNF